jgi:hypothetical protein
MIVTAIDGIMPVEWVFIPILRTNESKGQFGPSIGYAVLVSV